MVRARHLGLPRGEHRAARTCLTIVDGRAARRRHFANSGAPRQRILPVAPSQCRSGRVDITAQDSGCVGSLPARPDCTPFATALGGGVVRARALRQTHGCSRTVCTCGRDLAIAANRRSLNLSVAMGLDLRLGSGASRLRCCRVLGVQSDRGPGSGPLHRSNRAAPHRMCGWVAVPRDGGFFLCKFSSYSTTQRVSKNSDFF